MDIVKNHFPEVSSSQVEQFSLLARLYEEWNAKINVVSRKDIHKLPLHHVLHSLAIAKIIKFAKGTHVIDVGTGGGFPGIPLAIIFPEVNFTLVDSIGKKILVTQSVAKSLGLTNVSAQKARAEEVQQRFDFAVIRAVAPLPKLFTWMRPIIKPGGFNQLPNGIIALKGGDLKGELSLFGDSVKRWRISSFFDDEYFVEKYVVYVAR